MAEMTCPWCEARLPVLAGDQATEQTCPECLTRWCYEDPAADEWLPLAA